MKNDSFKQYTLFYFEIISHWFTRREKNYLAITIVLIIIYDNTIIIFYVILLFTFASPNNFSNIFVFHRVNFAFYFQRINSHGKRIFANDFTWRVYSRFPHRFENKCDKLAQTIHYFVLLFSFSPLFLPRYKKRLFCYTKIH